VLDRQKHRRNHGTPFEGKREINNISGFTSPEGKALPNDDLDLQLIWLKAMEERGPPASMRRFSANTGSITSAALERVRHWKATCARVCCPRPPGSTKTIGSTQRRWIRSEIWACLAPGCPDAAIAYAFEDACVDHGLGEGTYAELFTAAMQSAAFVEKDPKTLLNIGLS
jgi:hypothetical protein